MDFSAPTTISPTQFPGAPLDSPRSKRPRFQPDTFPFPTIQSWDNSTIEHQTFSTPLIYELADKAPLPEEIEASLLQVGMRIRKAVPEGYKTLNTFRPRPFFNMHRLSPQTQAALTGGNQSRSELNPYSVESNIHNIGGLPQPISTATFCGINLASIAAREAASTQSWGSPGYSYEQSQMWSYSTSHKRSFNNTDSSDSDDSEDWLPQTPIIDADTGFGMPMPADYFAIDVDSMSDVSPLTQVREFSRRQEQTLQHPFRKVAKAVSRTKRMQQAQPTSEFNPFAGMALVPEQQQQLEQPQAFNLNLSFGIDFGFDQATPQAQPQPEPVQVQRPKHHRVLSCGMEAAMGFDFGEAGFLARREDVEMDCS